MKKVFQFSVQFNYFRDNDGNTSLIAIAPNGQCLGLLSSFDDVGTFLSDLTAHLDKSVSTDN